MSSPNVLSWDEVAGFPPSSTAKKVSRWHWLLLTYQLTCLPLEESRVTRQHPCCQHLSDNHKWTQVWNKGVYPISTVQATNEVQKFANSLRYRHYRNSAQFFITDEIHSFRHNRNSLVQIIQKFNAFKSIQKFSSFRIAEKFSFVSIMQKFDVFNNSFRFQH